PEEIIADPAVDAVVLCHPTFAHYQALRLFLPSGKYILCEKPMVRHRGEAEAIRREPNAATKLAIGFMRRQQPPYQKIKQWIDDGTLGAIRMVKMGCNVAAYKRLWDDWFADFALCGGVPLDMLSHHFNLLNWYFGMPRQVCGAGLMFDRPMEQPVDYISGSFVYADGMIANIDGSWQRQGVGYDRIEVYGDKATALFDQRELMLCRPGQNEKVDVGQPVAPYVEQMKSFVATVAAGGVPAIGVEDGYWAFRTADALIESAKTGRFVTFED
ncbi:MAG: Gfo/Idh/MocA family oxidoreductase, partial [Lentisphaeria bacterium]|nr:Gfo/Idh/MocA family oxidoreductase [Lentisphaeria bacterium]